MRRILILEDQPLEQKKIMDLIGMITDKTEVICCADTKEAYVHALEGNIDLFIVDVILQPEKPEDTSGLKFIESIRGVTRYEFTPVIIITCLEDLKSYSYANLHCYAYIEKPFSAEHLKNSIAACLRSPQLAEPERHLYYRKDGAILAICLNEITYVTSIMHKLHIHTEKGDCIVVPYLSVRQFLEDALSRDFIQCGRGTVVNRKYVSSIDPAGRKIFLRGGNDTVEIGGSFVASVKAAFGGGKHA
ncbi:MAG: response regulator transcription factor [Lachnospiraceae bacterium]|nr:response regulator transcription factor [Lachnospiraceae bacterium]